MKSRTQLRAEGVELHGPIVPDWFKKQSDGCSVPTRIGRLFLKAEQARAACYIHDFGYYLTALQYHEGSAKHEGARMAADYNLKRNRKLVARTRMFGWIYSRMYFRAVRIGGKYAMKGPEELAVPPTVADVEALGRYLNKPFTPLAVRTIYKWIRLHNAGI